MYKANLYRRIQDLEEEVEQLEVTAEALRAQAIVSEKITEAFSQFHDQIGDAFNKAQYGRIVQLSSSYMTVVPLENTSQLADVLFWIAASQAIMGDDLSATANFGVLRIVDPYYFVDEQKYNSKIIKAWHDSHKAP